MSRIGTTPAYRRLYLLCLLLMLGLAGAASANVISWNLDDNGTVGSTSGGTSPNQAGVILVSNWVNSYSANPTTSLMDNTGNATTLNLSYSSYVTYSIQGSHPGVDADGYYNKELLNGYLNSGATQTPTTSSFTISGVPYTQYSIYVYFSSDTAGRTGTISDGTTTYSFSTVGSSSISGANASFIQTTDTGTGYPTANYAVFTGLTTSSATITCNIPLYGGIAGFQVVDTGTPPPVSTWNGGSSSGNNWSDGNNWVGGTPPATSGNILIFAGSTRTSPIMDQNYSIDSLNFSNNAAAFTLSASGGSTLTLGGNLINDSASAQTLTMPINVAAGSTWYGGGQNLLASGALSGSGGVTWLGTGTLTLGTGTSSLGGQLGIANGALVIPGGSLTLGGTLVVGSGAVNGSATATIANATVTLNGQLQAGYAAADANSVSGTINVSNSTMNANDDVVLGHIGTGNVTLNLQGNSVFNMASTAEKWLYIGDGPDYGNIVSATVNVGSGTTMNVNSAGKIRMSGGWGGGTNTFNLNGNLTFYDGNQTGAGTNGLLDMHYGYGPARDIFNLNAGGILTVANINANYASTDNGTRIFNFDGGKLVAAYNGGLNIGTDANQFVNINTTSPTIIDTAGYSFDIQSPLLHATGASVDGGLTKQGAGTLTLSASNTFNGPITVSAGTLMLTPAEQGSNTVSLAGGATLGVIQGSAATVGNVTMANNTTNRILLTTGSNPASAILKVGTLTLNGTTTLQLAGTIQTGSFTVLSCTSHTGAGSYNSTVVGPQGFVGTVGWDGTGTNLVVNVTSAGGLVWQGGTPYWDKNNDSGFAANNWLVNGSTATDYQETTPPGDAVTFNDTGASGVAIYDVVSPASVVITNSSEDYTFASLGGYISGMTSLTKTGSRTVTMGAANDYSGNTVISQGTFQLGIANAVPNGSGKGNFVLNGTLDLNAFDCDFNNLSGSGTVVNSGASLSRFRVNMFADSTFSGVIAGGMPGSLNEISLHSDNGNGTLTLSGNQTNYLQNMQLNAGTLKITAGKYITDSGGNFTVLEGTANMEMAGGVFDITAAPGAGAYFGISDYSSGGNTNTLLVDGGTIVVSNNLGTYVGTVGTGVLNMNSGLFVNEDQTNGGVVVGAGGQGATVNLNGGVMQVNIISNQTGNAVFNFNGGTLKPLASTTNFFGDYSGNLTANVLPGGARIDTAGNNITIAQPLVGAGSLTKSGSGTLTLSGNSSYTGGTTVSNGTLSLAAGGYSGAIVGTLTINSSATVQLNAGDALGFGTPDSSVTNIVINDGTLNNNVSANNSYQASWTLNGGTMSSTGGGAFHIIGGSGSITSLASANVSTISGNIAIRGANSTLSINVADGAASPDLLISGAITNSPYDAGNNGIAKSGAGTLVLSGVNGYTGNTTINAGVLELAQSFPTLATNSIVTIAGGAQLKLDNSAVTNQVASLITNGVAAADGVYSSANSSGFITGAGHLQVAAVGPSGPETLTNSYNAGTHTLTLSWPAGQGWRLQSRTNLVLGSWQYITDGSISSTNIPVDTTKPTVFYRLAYP